MRSAVRTKEARVKGSNRSQLGDNDSKEARVSDLGDRSERERKQEFYETKKTQVFFLFKNLGSLVGSYELEINGLKKPIFLTNKPPPNLYGNSNPIVGL